MTKLQIELIAKWRGHISGGRVVFPTSWHKAMYQRELSGQPPRRFIKRPKSDNLFFQESFNAR